MRVSIGVVVAINTRIYRGSSSVYMGVVVVLRVRLD